ncbi:unnamed protein product, partial [Musa textilis]
MKRYKGFKLGRRLVRVWRWVVRRRPGRYLRLDTATECSTSKPNLPNTCKTEASRLFRWGHHFARRLRRGPHASPGEFGAEAPLLDGEGGRGWRTRPPPKGHLPVYVGGESDGGLPRRYVVPVVYFNHPLLRSCCGRRRWSSGSTTPAASPSPAPPPSSSASGRAFPTPARGFTEGAPFPFG